MEIGADAVPGNQLLGESSIEAGYILIGKHFYRREDVQFQSLSVNFTYLEEWLGMNPFSMVPDFSKKTFHAAELRSRNHFSH